MVVVMRPRTAWSRPSLVLSSGERDGGDGVWIVVVAASRSRRPRNSWICHSTSSGDVGGDGVESREETRIGDEGRDIECGVGSGEVFTCFLGGTRRRWEVKWCDGRLIYLIAQPYRDAKVDSPPAALRRVRRSVESMSHPNEGSPSNARGIVADVHALSIWHRGLPQFRTLLRYR